MDSRGFREAAATAIDESEFRDFLELFFWLLSRPADISLTLIQLPATMTTLTSGMSCPP